MGEKISTIILKVDLDCRSCYKKISKTVWKLQERENFQTIAFDEKNNTVTISGPFDPEKICKKLCCKAGKVIKDIQIKEKPKDKPKDEPKKDKPKDEPKKDKPKDDKPKDEPKKDKPKDEPKKDKPKEDDKPKDEPKKDKPKDEPKKDKPKDEPKKDKPKDEPKKSEPEKPKTLKPNPPASEPVKTEPVYVVPEPQPGYQPGWQPGSGCACGCGSGYGGYYGDNRCCWCGRGPGWVPEGQPTVVYGAPAYKTCTFFCEEDPQSTCSVM